MDRVAGGNQRVVDRETPKVEHRRKRSGNADKRVPYARSRDTPLGLAGVLPHLLSVALGT
jgi:hypothetical protein